MASGYSLEIYWTEKISVPGDQTKCKIIKCKRRRSYRLSMKRWPVKLLRSKRYQMFGFEIQDLSSSLIRVGWRAGREIISPKLIAAAAETSLNSTAVCSNSVLRIHILRNSLIFACNMASEKIALCLGRVSGFVTKLYPSADHLALTCT